MADGLGQGLVGARALLSLRAGPTEGTRDPKDRISGLWVCPRSPTRDDVRMQSQSHTWTPITLQVKITHTFSFTATTDRPPHTLAVFQSSALPGGRLDRYGARPTQELRPPGAPTQQSIDPSLPSQAPSPGSQSPKVLPPRGQAEPAYPESRANGPWTEQVPASGWVGPRSRPCSFIALSPQSPRLLSASLAPQPSHPPPAVSLVPATPASSLGQGQERDRL